MNVAGFNLYRVLYLCPPVETVFQRLVVASNEAEARALVPGQFKLELIENDISMVISPAALPPSLDPTELEVLEAKITGLQDAMRPLLDQWAKLRREYGQRS